MNITIDRNGTKHGPYTLEQIKEYLGNGTFNENDWAWYEGCTDWLPIKAIITPATTPPPPPKLAPPPPPVVFLKTNLGGPDSEPTQPRVDNSVKRSLLSVIMTFRGITTTIQCIAWIICVIVLVLNGLHFLGELTRIQADVDQNGGNVSMDAKVDLASAAAKACTYFIGAYVFARVVEKICNLIAPK